jgi:hypothetical protein
VLPSGAKVNSITPRHITPVPTPVISPGVFPRGVYGVYGSSGTGYFPSTATFKIMALSTSGYVTI